MIRRRSQGLVFFAFAVMALAAGTALADAEAHGRVSFADQSGLVKGKDDSDWSYASLNSLVTPGDTLWADEKSALEIEFPSGIYVRLADGSKLDVMEAPPSALFKGATGSFYVQRIRRSAGDVTFDTPVGAVAVSPDSQVRIDILGEGATTITVRWGNATIHAEGGEPIELKAGERSFVDPGYLPSKPVGFDRSQEDAFDTWNRSRARDVAEGSVPTPIQSSFAGGEAPVGVNELNGRGDWVYIDNTPYWHPSAADYVPYRNGYWSYVPVQGYVWVDDYPWAYVTTHYGHWRYDAGYGWCWGYYGAYRPAYAYTLHYGDSFIWAPLGIYGYPVCYDSYASFSLGNVNFSYGFSSCAYDYDVFSCGGFHSIFIVDFGRIYDDHHHHRHNDCDYWNINSGHNPGHDPGHDPNHNPNPGPQGDHPHFPGGTSKTFPPAKIFRGTTVGADGKTHAADRATLLQTHRPGASANGTGPVLRTARATQLTPTAPSARRAELRNVNIAAPAATHTALSPRTPGRTYANDQARVAGPLSHGSATNRPAVPTDRTGASPLARNSQPAQIGSANSGAVGPNPAAQPTTGRPLTGINRNYAAERPHPTTTRPEVAQGPLPQVVRPSAPSGQPEQPNRQQYSRPVAPDRGYEPPTRQQYGRPEAAPPQVTRPEVSRPSYQRPAETPQMQRPTPQYSPPAAPQPRTEYRAPAPAPAPSGRSFEQPSNSFRGGNESPSEGRQGNSFGRPR